MSTTVKHIESDCICGCGRKTRGGDFAPGCDRRAMDQLIRDAYGQPTIADAVRKWSTQHPGETIHKRIQEQHLEDSGVKAARKIVQQSLIKPPKGQLVSDELIAERRAEAERESRRG